MNMALVDDMALNLQHSLTHYISRNPFDRMLVEVDYDNRE